MINFSSSVSSSVLIFELDLELVLNLKLFSVKALILFYPLRINSTPLIVLSL